MKARRVLAVALATPLTWLMASPALAQQTYPPEVLSTSIVFCDNSDAITITVDGVQPNSNVHIVIDYTGAPDVDTTLPADGLGYLNTSFPIPPNVQLLIVVTISG